MPAIRSGLSDDEVTAARQELDDLPATDATGKASFPVKLDKIPATSRPLEATHHRQHGGIRRPRGRAQADAADRARRRR